MENASKALIIAGGVLIAIIIVSIGIYLRGNIAKVGESYIQTLDTAELHKYNTNFEVYAGRTDLTAQDIVTVISIAKQKDMGTEVYVNGIVVNGIRI